jgi:seryl-tRNA synthetase
MKPSRLGLNPSFYSKQSNYKMTIEEQLSTVETLAQALTAERDDLRSTVEKLTVGAADELTAVKAEVVTKDARISELTVAFEAATAEIATLKALVSDLEASKVSASKEAANIVAKTGSQPVLAEQPSVQTEKSVEQIREEYSTMKPSAERVAFLKKHQAAILYGRTK